MEKNWLISVWDGSTIRKFFRFGTYEQVSNICRNYPSGYIWSVS